MSKNKNKKEIKEYIYLDNIEINSLLAQFEDGIPKVIQSIKQTGLSNTQTTNKNGHKETQLGLPNNNVTVGDSQDDSTSETASNMSQEAISTVYNDYAVDIVSDELSKCKLLNLSTQQSEGDYVQIESNFDIIDPASMGSNFDTTTIKNFFNLSDKVNLESKGTFSTLQNISKLLNDLFPNSILIKTKNSLIIAEDKNFRMNNAQLRMLNFSTRKIIVLGKVESRLSNSDIQFNDSQKANIKDILSIMSKLGFFIISSVTGLKDNDKLIKPLAIYFK